VLVGGIESKFGAAIASSAITSMEWYLKAFILYLETTMTYTLLKYFCPDYSIVIIARCEFQKIRF